MKLSIIDKKLIEAYSVLVLADRYIFKEADRKSKDQKIVPSKYANEIEVKVAERTIEVLENNSESAKEV